MVYVIEIQAYDALHVKLSHWHHADDNRERMYSSYSFLTSALEGVSGQSHSPAALYPRRKDHRYL
jgi:hypothetical protein